MYRLILASLALPLLVGCGSGGIAPVAAIAPAATTLPAPPTPLPPVPPVVSSPAPVTAPVTPTPVATCVTFIGDSLTAYWPMSYLTSFDGGCYVNKGVGGTTLPQILDDIDDHALPYDATVDPATSRIVVVGGDAYNSIFHGLDAEAMEAQYTLILAKLRGLGVQIVLCTVLPSDVQPYNVQVVLLDDWLRATAAAQDIPLVDLYKMPGLVDPDGMLDPAHTLDGIHILAGDYGPFTPYVEAAIRQAAVKL